jgi:diadenosine tetraphosphatase ApaH/serine/threonine PP2A family protein phosphatase
MPSIKSRLPQAFGARKRGFASVGIRMSRSLGVCGNVVTGGTYSKFRLDRSRKYFVNVGSVGQPRGLGPEATYVVYDGDEQTIELRRVPYDAASAQRKVRDSGMN